MKKRNVVIAGGGTGGHIYPGLALAERLAHENPDVQVHFVGAKGGLEESIVPRHGYPLHLLSVGRMHSSIGLWRRLKTLLTLPLSFFQALYIFFKLRPLWVLGIGGFASGPIVFVAAFLRGRTALLEPNAFPGMANRYLCRWVDYCFLVFSETARFFPDSKVRTVGLPVRIEKSEANNRLPAVFDSKRKLRILVFGGSQGARGINQVVGAWLQQNLPSAQRVEVVHQVGARDWPQWQKAYSQPPRGLKESLAYLHDMPERLQWADLCICRAGIGTVAEVAMSCTPALFVPLPTAADDHQRMNGETLVGKGASLMCLQKDFNLEALESQIQKILDTPEILIEMSKALVEVDYSNAPEKILSVLMEGKV